MSHYATYIYWLCSVVVVVDVACSSRMSSSNPMTTRSSQTTVPEIEQNIQSIYSQFRTEKKYTLKPKLISISLSSADDAKYRSSKFGFVFPIKV